MKRHGFETNNHHGIIPDWQLLVQQKDTVLIFQQTMKYIEYIEWKTEALEKIIATMMEDWSTRDRDFEQRLHHRIEAKELCERLVKAG